MFKPFSLFVGLRYTLSKNRQGFISFISALAMLGMVFGVAAMITVLSVMNGFDHELKKRILNLVPHVLVFPEESGAEMTDWEAAAGSVSKQPEVLAVAPFIQREAMLSVRGRVQGVQVNGIDPEYESQVSDLATYMQQGELAALERHAAGVVIGQLLARSLAVGMGSELTLVVPQLKQGGYGVVPQLVRLQVVGLFKSGSDLDTNQIYVNLERAQNLADLPVGSVQGLRIKVGDWFQAPLVAAQLEQSLGEGYRLENWTNTHGSLFAAIQLEKTMVALLLMLIVAVAAFNVVATLIMVVTDKQADIAILRAMGASSRSIMWVFICQGLLIGVVGLSLGCLLGVILSQSVGDLLAWLEQVFGARLFSPDIYFVSYLPSKLEIADVVIIALSALILSFLATLYPSMRAAKLEPAEALRYE